jgi:hypothetical protein
MRFPLWKAARLIVIPSHLCFGSSGSYGERLFRERSSRTENHGKPFRLCIEMLFSRFDQFQRKGAYDLSDDEDGFSKPRIPTAGSTSTSKRKDAAESDDEFDL